MTDALVKPLRIDHWTKNLVLIIGFIFAVFYNNNYSINYYTLIFAFLILCISASSNYLINEFLDRRTDKFHPIKKLRTFVRLNKGNESKKILIEYFFLISFSLTSSYFINQSFFILNLVFIFFGIIYNVRPIRIKDIFLLDVILESVNNPLRFLMGWSVLMPNYFPPISIVLFFWLSGCFLMTMKRYSEYCYLVKHIKPEKYRLSFKHYNKKNLFELSILYSLSSLLFFTIFVIKYKIELIIIIPIGILLYLRVFKISTTKNSLIMRVEKIYRDKIFLYIALLAVTCAFILLRLDLNYLEIFLKKDLIKF
jgi:decaprenyl-phosphate phosphoribosyltransferase